MYHSFIKKIAFIILFLPLFANGQGTGNSPYSQFGIGDLSSSYGSIRNMGMGNAGVSNRHHHYINLLNPALLGNLRNPKKLRPNHKYLSYDHFLNQRIDSTVKIDFALTYQMRSLQAATGYENASGINIAYLAFSLPLAKTWATSIGITPFSVANYNLGYSTPVLNKPGVTVQNETSGKGGIYKLFWAHGFGITQNLSLGLEAAYLFGNINTESTTIISDFSTKSYGFQAQNRYSALSLKPGLNFRKEIIKSYRDTVFTKDSSGLDVAKLIRKTKSSGYFYNVGLTYDYYSAFNLQRNLNLFIIENNNQIFLDSPLDTTSYKSKLPPSFRLGVSIDKPMKFSVAADVFYSDWSVYKSSFSTDTMASSYGFSIGSEFVPGQLKLKSVTYRLGFTYMKSPTVMNGKQLDDMSLSIGGTVPFGRRSHTSPVIPRVNVALVAGQRGDITNFGIKEQYLKVYLSLLINEKWFNKRKIY